MKTLLLFLTLSACGPQEEIDVVSPDAGISMAPADTVPWIPNKKAVFEGSEDAGMLEIK